MVSPEWMEWWPNESPQLPESGGYYFASVSPGFCPEWMEWWANKSRIRPPQLSESAHITCKSGGYLPVSGGQLALEMAEVTTTGRTLLTFTAQSCPVALWTHLLQME